MFACHEIRHTLGSRKQPGYRAGPGLHGLFYQRLVDNEQLALQASSFGMPLDKAGLFSFIAIANSGVEFATIEKAIKEEIALH